LGNHDVRNIPREKWAELVGVDNSYYSFDLGGYHHVVLDGNRTEPRGPLYIREEQMKWLEEDLAKTNLRTLVYCHFPMDNQNMDSNYYFKEHPETASLGNKVYVRTILRKSGKVLAVFSGHTHFFSQQTIDSIIYCTAPSFSENNGDHEPNGQYAIVSIEGDKVEIEIKKSERSI
jgi:alkaline phosphatase